MAKIRQARLIGHKIRVLRKKRSLSQSELARRIGIQQSDLSRMEKGEYRVSLDTLFKILQVFEMSMAEFFEEVVDDQVTQRDKEMLEEYHRLSTEGKKEVREFIRFKLAQEGKFDEF